MTRKTSPLPSALYLLAELNLSINASGTDGLDEIPDLLRLDANGCEASTWVENFMGWLD